MNLLSYQALLNEASHRVIFRGVWGSHAYGTALPTSDKDSIGVFVLEKKHYLFLTDAPTQFSDERNDNTFYALRNYMNLAAKANPNILDSLFLPSDCVLQSSHYWDILQANRMLFVTQMASQTYCEYAMSQIKKAKGCNKRVHNPQPVETPTEADYCTVILKDAQGRLSGRPLSLKATGIRLENCHVAAVEHSSESFRLYDYGTHAKGVFRNGMLVCESIPKDDEADRFIGLLIFNKNGFIRAKNEHRQYWDWYNNRNAARWQTQLSGEMDYDVKNLMHTFRLLYSGINVMKEGEPLVRFTGKKLDKLMAIRRGEFAYQQLLDEADAIRSELMSLHEKSSLPPTANLNKVNEVLFEITDLWERDHAR